jgi:hypothetical protein
MTPTNRAPLQIVFRNPDPPPEVQLSRTWLLCTHGHENLSILVACDGVSRPRIVRKHAA